METDNLTVHSSAKKKEKREDLQQRTIRFKLELKESNDKYFPEFSFKELLRSALVGEEKGKDLPVEGDEENEKLQALAKKFEEKYGPKQKLKKKRKERIQDLIDVTYGYDDTDPFVDNSEAYDELLPSDWTTEHGGFYINQGGLNFKPLSDDDSDSEDFKGVKKRKTPKKLKDPNKVKKVKEGGEKKRKHSAPSDKEKKPRKIRLISGDKEKKYRKKLHSSEISNGSSSVIMKMISTTSSVISIPPNTSPVSVSSLTSSVVNNVTPAMSAEGSPQDKANVKTETDDSLAKLMENSLPSQESNINDLVNQNGLPPEGATTFVPQLPTQLPLSIEACVQKLKLAANNAADEGKCKFFNKDVNQLLLEIETKSRELSCRIRSGIYDYLAFYLPCTKETLLKRAKKLLLTDQAGRLREPMAKLKAAVNKVMPDQIKAFEDEVRRHVEEQSKNTGVAEQSPEDKKKELFKSAMEVDDEGEKQDEVTNPSTPIMEEKTKTSLPRRKFVWSEELRELLHDVVTLRVKLFEMSKTRTTSAEEYLKEFFETEVKSLWPKGWMTSRILFKESKSVHTRLTSAQLKPKKVPGPKKQETIPLSEQADMSGQVPVPKENTNPLLSTISATTSSSTIALTTVKANVMEQLTTTTLTAGNSKTLPKLNPGALSMLKAKIIQVKNPGNLGKTNMMTQLGNKPVSAVILSGSKTTNGSVAGSSSVPLKSPTSIGLTASKPALTVTKNEITTMAKPLLTMATTPSVSMVTSVPKPADINAITVNSRGAVTKVESTVDKRPEHMDVFLAVNSLQQQQQQQKQQQQQQQQPGQHQQQQYHQNPHQQQQQQQQHKQHHPTQQHNLQQSSQQQHHTSQQQQHQQKQQWQQHQQQQQLQKHQQHQQQQQQQQQQVVQHQKLPQQHQHEQDHSQQIKSPVNSLGQLSSNSSSHFHQQTLQNTGMKSTFHQPGVTVKTPPSQPSNPVIKSQPVTILDFADMMSTESSDDPQEMLNNQIQQQTRYADKSPSPQKPKDTSLPSKGSTSVMSPQRQQPNPVYTSPSSLMRSPSQMTQARNNVQQSNAALANMLLGMSSANMQNKFIDLNAASLMAQQRQQAANTKTILDTITSPSRMTMDMHSSSVPLSHPMISLTNPTPSVSTFMPNSLQQPTLSMLGHTNLGVKNTNPLSHLGMVADPVASSMMHINRPLQQQVQQSGMVMSPNPFNQVLVGYNIPSTQGNTPIQMSQSSILNNQNIFQDPNQNPSTAHPPSPFMPRFS